MAEDTIDNAIMVGGLDEKKCVTEHLHIHGYSNTSWDSTLHVYGSEKVKLKRLIKENQVLGEPIADGLAFTKVQIVWGVRNEMARTVEDVLARRTRCLFLDARTSISAAPMVAEIMAEELNKSGEWVLDQVESFTEIAKGYYWPS